MDTLKCVLSRVSFLLLFALIQGGTKAQTYDTISNWDGIAREWYISTGTGGYAGNPLPDAVNNSEGCFRVVTGSGLYDFMICDLDGPVNFDENPRYRIKVLAPSSGGHVVLKFENYNNTASQEMLMTPVPGQWTDLVFDFSGLSYNNLTRMVIFYDFMGTAAGKEWFIDDVLSETPGPLTLESHLPIFVINTFGVPIQDEPKIDGHLGIIDNGAGNMNNLNDPYNHYDGAIGIEIRGQSSQMFPKKSYSFETRTASGSNLNVPLLGMPQENDWVLYAPYSDKSMLRNVVTFAMARRMEGYVTRTRFCEVVVNNDYKGVYVLMERIKRDANRVDIATLNPDEVSGDDVTGGYILRVDKLDPDYIPDMDGWVSSVNPTYPQAVPVTFQYFYPKNDEIVQPQRAYIRDFVTAAEAALAGNNFLSRTEGYIRYLDLPSFVDFMLLNEISKEVDKYKYSTYFYKHKDSDGGKLFAGPPWDFNLGYGNVDYWPEGLSTSGWLYATVTSGNPGMMYWWKRLMDDSYFRDLAKTRWQMLRQTTLTNAYIHSVIDSLVEHIGDAKERNYQRWPILGQYVWPNYNWQNNTYADEVDYFEDFLFDRLAWMDYNMPGSTLAPWAGIYAEGNRIRVQLYGDYFRTDKLRKEFFSLNNAPGIINIQQVIYIDASCCDLLLSADPAAFPAISVNIGNAAVNSWDDIVSSTLAASGVPGADAGPENVSVGYSPGLLSISCRTPELLPEKCEIYNVSGQLFASVRLDKCALNSIPVQLSPGIWILRLTGRNTQLVKRFVVAL